MREFHPMPTTLKAMRHFEHADKRADWQASQIVSFSQTVSHSQKMENRHPVLVTPTETYPPLPSWERTCPVPDTGAGVRVLGPNDLV